MFSRSARLYDAIYHWKDYPAEAASLHELIQARRPGAATLLDVACGTGAHLAELARWYSCVGVDLDRELLAIARERLPAEVDLYQTDMRAFDLGRGFDAVICMFSSVGYVGDRTQLERAVASMARHLEPGGVLVVEPWLSPDRIEVPHVGAVFVDEPELKIARINTVEVDGRRSILELNYLVGRPDRVEHFTETHELTLFEVDETLEAFRAAGLEVEHDPEAGPMGRGLYVAKG
ncbi:MAG TPA: class I SAM-dependent methyltransferase [Gaiellaceae bacterium]